MKKLLKKFRDHPFVLPVCISALHTMRTFGLMRSRRIYSHVPYRGIVSVDCGNGRSFRIRSLGHNIENGLYWAGLFAHEPASMRAWTERASRARVVLDIGANSGVFALAASAMGAREVHAFEPLARIHALMAGNFDLNRTAGLRAWHCAVGSNDGSAKIFDPGGEQPTSASLSSEFASSHFGDIGSHEVSVRSIDSFCREHCIQQVDLIKIDVEGYEAEALRGMREIVACSKPDMLMEVLPGQEGSLRRVVEELWPGLFDWNRIEEGDEHVSRNFLLTPPADASVRA